MTGKGDRGDSLPPSWRGRSPEAWARQIGVPLLQVHERLPSTNAHLRELARAGVPPFTIVIAEEQSAGRGREGRGWHSPSGTGLWLSVLLSLEPKRTVGVIPLAVGVAVAIAIERLTDARVGLKWPNDVLVDSRKVAGILCESTGDSGEFVAVGIGVNLRRPAAGFPADLERSAGFLDELTDGRTAEPDLTKGIVDELRRWTRPTPVTLSGRLRVEWEARDRLRGRRVRLESGAVGIARGVSLKGTLRVALPDGPMLTVRAGGVRIEEPGSSPALDMAGTRDSKEGGG